MDMDATNNGYRVERMKASRTHRGRAFDRLVWVPVHGGENLTAEEAVKAFRRNMNKHTTRIVNREGVRQEQLQELAHA